MRLDSQLLSAESPAVTTPHNHVESRLPSCIPWFGENRATSIPFSDLDVLEAEAEAEHGR